MFRTYDIPGIVMCGGICFLNMANMKRSPQYTFPTNTTDMIRFTSLSVIYGFFWPFSLAGIALDLGNKNGLTATLFLSQIPKFSKKFRNVKVFIKTKFIKY